MERQVVSMSTYEIIMICISAVNLVLSLVKAVKGKKRK